MLLLGVGGTTRPAGSLAGGPVYYVNPTTGNDANSGLAPSLAWQTWGKLIASVGGFTTGDWINPLASVTTYAARKAWYATYKAGGQRLTGGTIAIDTSGGPLTITAVLTVPAGWEIMSATGVLADLRINVPLTETWVLVSGNVYKSTGTSYNACVPYEKIGGDWVAMDPVSANTVVTVIATATTALQAAAGSFWTDPATGILYIHPRGNGNPNSDAVVREYSPQWAALTENRAIDLNGSGRAYLLGVDGGHGYTFSDGLPHGKASIGFGEWTGIRVVDNCKATRNGKHSFSFTGNNLDGFAVLCDSIAKQGPGSIALGNVSHLVDFTSGSGTGTIDTIYDNIDTRGAVQAIGAIGGTDSAAQDNVSKYPVYVTHGGTGRPKRNLLWINNVNVTGSVSLSDGSTANAEVIDSDFLGGFSFDGDTLSLSTTSGQRMIGYGLPSIGATVAPSAASITNYDFRPGSVYTGAQKPLAGTFTFSDCRFFLAGGTYASSMWARVAAYSATLSGSTTITDWYAANRALFAAFTVGTDTISIASPTLVAADNWQAIQNYNSTGVARTWAQMVSDGRVTTPTYDRLIYVDANNSLLWKDSIGGTLATADGDAVAFIQDFRDDAKLGYMYWACTGVTLKVTAGRKTLLFNGTTSTANLMGGGAAQDLNLSAHAYSWFQQINPVALSGYAPAATSEPGTGGFRLFMQLGTAKWGTYGASDNPSGTTLVTGTNYQLGMAAAADNSGNFYTNGAADGTFAASSGSGGNTIWDIMIGHETAAARFGNLKTAGWTLTQTKLSSGQAATEAALLAAMQ